ncbi:MAG: gluconate transporter [Chitinophagia bacterium]|jgi:Gnt-I system high-affinity gluconate transporter|nr:gluconate transporter [Chitinophagia bacterium]
MLFLTIAICIVLLILLISWAKCNTFISFIIVSLLGGLLLGMPLEKIPGAIQKGVGDTLGSLLMVILFGAMIGKMVAESGAAQRISDVLLKAFGEKKITWALVLTGFIVGIPLFYNVGFVLLVPLIFSIVYRLKLPAVYVGIPMLSALSVTHGLLPPHPSPAALVNQLHADMGKTLLYGICIAIPTIIVAGPLFATTLKKMDVEPLQTFKPKEIKEASLPGFFNSIITCLLPVFILLITTYFNLNKTSSTTPALIQFISDPSMLMFISMIYATVALGITRGNSIANIMHTYADSIKDVLMIILIVSGAGALKEVYVQSGVSAQLGDAFNQLQMPPLLLGWLISAIIRVAMGSATVAGLTTAGIIAPVVVATNTDPSLMVLAVGSGSLMLSHVNDSGFWLFKEYFNLSIRQTLKSWTIMETIVSVMGLLGVLIIDYLIK